MSTPTEKLKVINDALNQTFVSSEEFVKAFKTILDILLKKEKSFEENFEKSLAELQGTYNQVLKKLNDEKDLTLIDVKKEVKVQMERMLKDHMKKMEDMDMKMGEMKDGEPGDDGHTPTKEELLGLIKPLILPPVKGDSYVITEKDIEEIVRKVLEKTSRPRSLFGYSPRMRDMWIDETPDGTPNGSLTTFTLSTNIIDNSEIVRIGGQIQEAITDYTLAGRTITFVVAPATDERIRVKYQKL